MSTQQLALEACAYAIVADIGGTNARFSLVDLVNLTVDKVAVFPCANFPNLKDALIYYRTMHDLSEIKHATIAIACPVISDNVVMTNCTWNFSISQLKDELGFSHLQVLNDLSAAAMSLPILTAEEKVQIGSGEPDLTKPMVMLGVGTGLGVAHLIPTSSCFMPLSGEGGHTAWAAQSEQEWFIQRFLMNRFGHVSSERLLSGPGLENLYLAIAAYQGLTISPLPAAEIVRLALNNESTLAIAVVEQFFASLGSYAGDLALKLCTFGGVYITGGVVPKLLSLMEQSEFRARFETKGRFSALNKQVPSYVVTAKHPGLVGAALYLKQIMESE
ncbi:glucokinase [Legionella beliardensis]|uniref:Glucokinase n=1 Tax=Legionella beliardensis TaxID=91822 RepID=A0A378I1W8_9GAMM|nr:glucokinase [Legionella beliardensis]STX28710.1 glucokinase [Legionella beliardensis]